MPGLGRSRTVLWVSAVIGTIALPCSAADGRPGHNCATRGRTVLATRVARVFEAHYDISDDFETYACLYRGGGAKRLEYTSYGDSSTHYGGRYQLAGRYAALVEVDCEAGGCVYRPKTFDLRLRRIVRYYENPETSIAAVFSMRLAKNGSIAVLKRNFGLGYCVCVVEADGTRTLDSGPDIDPSSLALAGDRVYWMRGSVPQSATIH